MTRRQFNLVLRANMRVLGLATSLLGACADASLGPSFDCDELDDCAAVSCNTDRSCEPAIDEEPGDRSGLERCAGMRIDTRAQLEAARHCREIDGDLTFGASELTRITADDLPYLERVSGSLMLIPAGRGQITELTLPALREVGTSASDAASTRVEIGWDVSALQRISLPELSAVHGSLTIGVLGGLTELHLDRLAQVDGIFGLANLPQLTDLTLPGELQVGTRVSIDHLCRLPAQDLPSIPAAGEADEVSSVGCCTSSALECEQSICECG